MSENAVIKKKNDGVQLVIIAGPPRSGTTLLRTVLNNHPRVATTPEVKFFDVMWGERLHPRGIKHVIECIADKLASDKPIKLWRPKAKNKIIGELLPASNYSDLFMRTLASRASKSEYDAIVEKTPTNVLFIPTIRRWFPDSKLIITMRDGREVAASACKKWYTNDKYISVAALWMFIAKRYFKDIQKRDHLLMKYEDITRNPNEAFTKLFSYIGLSYDQKYAEDVETTSSFNEFHGNKGIHESSHYKKYFLKKERMYMEYFLRKYLILFGYDLEFSNYDIPLSIKFRWAYHSFNHWISFVVSRLGFRWWYKIIRI